MWEAERWPNHVSVLDADLGDKVLNERFHAGAWASRERVLNTLAQFGQFDRRRSALLARLKEFIQFFLSTAKVGCSRRQCPNSFTACRFREVSVLEGGQVALDRTLDLRQLTDHAGDLGLDASATRPAASLSASGRFLEEVGTSVRVDQRGDDRLVEGVGRQPRCAARVATTALARGACVVPVRAVPSGRRCSGEVPAAGVADDEAGQQIVRTVRGALGDVLAAFEQKRLRSVEQLRADERRMSRWVPWASEVHLT